MDLGVRLAAVACLVAEENVRLEAENIAGFLPYDPHALARAAIRLLRNLPPDSERRSIDLGAGTGAWWLLMASAGVPSFAIEIEPALVACAKRLRTACIARGLIDPSVPCSIVCADMVPAHWRQRYRSFRQRHTDVERNMPIGDDSLDPYHHLGLALNDAGIVYCWAWPTQSRFLFNLLAAESAPDAVFVLPSFIRYTQGEHMNAMLGEPNLLLLEVLDREGDIVIGRRTTD